MAKKQSKKPEFQKPELIRLTRKKPEKPIVKECCSANMSLLDKDCNRPMRG